MRKRCEEEGIHLQIIPGGTTSILQPLDIVVNKPLKDHLRNSYIPWMIGQTKKELQSTTKKGYVKPPSTDLILNWVEKATREISVQLIKTAFSKAGITNDEKRKEIFLKLDINLDHLVQK